MSRASRAHTSVRRSWRFGRVFIPFWIACVALFTFAAAADAIWDLGWGYSWDDVLVGLAMIVFGLVFFVAYYWMYRLMRFLTEIFYGPNSDQQDRSAR